MTSFLESSGHSESELRKYYPGLLEALPQVNDEEFLDRLAKYLSERQPYKLEEIVERDGYPPIRIIGGVFPRPDEPEWHDLHDDPAQKERIENAIAATGHLRYGADKEAAGTAWLIRPDLAVTARHGAELFAKRAPDGSVRFRKDENDVPFEVHLDMLDETPGGPSRLIRVVRPLWLEPRSTKTSTPDLALLEIDDSHGIEPLDLEQGFEASPGQIVAVIGYPGPGLGLVPVDPELFRKHFGDVPYAKRASPGRVLDSSKWRHPWEFWTNATIFHGSSGSPIIDVETGRSLGVHYDGTFEIGNYAVHARIVADRIRSLIGEGLLAA